MGRQAKNDSQSRFGSSSPSPVAVLEPPDSMQAEQLDSRVIDEILRLAEDARQGNLGARGNAGLFDGAERKLVEGVNAMLDAVVGPLIVAADYVDKISRGAIPAKITDQYNGDFNTIKNNLNNCVDNINALVADAGTLVKAAVEGKLATRADAGKHQGDYRKIVEGVNRTVDALVNHLDSMPAPAFIIGRDFDIRYINKVAAELSGLSAEAMLGTKCYDHFQTAHCRTEKCATGQCMQRGHTVNAETDAHPRGRNLEISYTGVPVKDLDGRIIGALEIITDQTAVKTAARVAGKQADYQAVEVGKLVSNLSSLAQGDVRVDTSVTPTDDDTRQIGENFGKINRGLEITVAAIGNLVADAGMLAQAAKEGKFGTRADAARHQGDYRKIVEGVNTTLETIVNTIIEPMKATSQTANALAASAEELTAVSQQMTGNAEETAAQANVVSAASEQVSKNVATVASGAEQMQASIREIAKNANESARVAKNAVSVAQSTNVTVAKLGESSQEIGNVIKVITSIAQQTNLLALNATIEAARAGEAGKGFAVVANEVKELAKQTAKATEEIGQKIEAIQGDTKGAVQAIGEIGTIINQINDISNSIASAVEEQTVTTNEIGRNVTEAAKGTNDIAKNISGVAVAAKNTTKGASDTQKAAQELSRMAAQLQAMVAKFQF